MLNMYFEYPKGSFLKQCLDIVSDLRGRGEKPDKDGCYHIHFSGIVGKYTYNALFDEFKIEAEIIKGHKINWTNQFKCFGILFSTDIKNYP